MKLHHDVSALFSSQLIELPCHLWVFQMLPVPSRRQVSSCPHVLSRPERSAGWGGFLVWRTVGFPRKVIYKYSFSIFMHIYVNKLDGNSQWQLRRLHAICCNSAVMMHASSLAVSFSSHTLRLLHLQVRCATRPNGSGVPVKCSVCLYPIPKNSEWESIDEQGSLVWGHSLLHFICDVFPVALQMVKTLKPLSVAYLGDRMLTYTLYYL